MEEKTDNFDISEKERELIPKLLADPTLTAVSDFYTPLKDKIRLYLSRGYKDKEIRAELSLSSADFDLLKLKFPPEWWETSKNESNRYIGRKRAGQLTEKTANDLLIVQTHDKKWNPKIQHEHKITNNPMSEKSTEELIELTGMET